MVVADPAAIAAAALAAANAAQVIAPVAGAAANAAQVIAPLSLVLSHCHRRHVLYLELLICPLQLDRNYSIKELKLYPSPYPK
eukprot:scaffold4587_cov29-Attheya_sp.AAC.1